MAKKKITPMMAQYLKIKSEHPDCFLFFRLGDFYEMFGDDAVQAAAILDITLTARGKGEDKIPMCGMPYHSAQGYITKLTTHGHKVAICEQVSDPTQPGIVQREVVRVVTPGTTLDENALNQKANHFVASIVADSKEQFSLALSDLTTGEFYVAHLLTTQDLKSEITRLQPTELIVSPQEIDKYKILLQEFPTLHIFPHETLFPPSEILAKHFQTNKAAIETLVPQPINPEAPANLIDYLSQTQKTDLSHINSIRTYSLQDFMPLDEATLRNLELFETIRDYKREGSLFNVIDSTITSMGGRLLKKWLLQPLTNLDPIQSRLTAVEQLTRSLSIREDLRLSLKPVRDIERLLARLSLNSGNARDLISLRDSLAALPEIKSTVDKLLTTVAHQFAPATDKAQSTPAVSQTNLLLEQLRNSLDLCTDIHQLLANSLLDEPPTTIREGNMISHGHNSELDELREISSQGKGFIQKLQQQEIARTGITSLKVKYNKVFGYYLEVSKSNLASVPEDYIRKQTLVNAERFITPELKEYEEKVLGAEDKIKALEYKIFQEIRSAIISQLSRLQSTANVIAQIDCLSSLAHTAVQNRYTKPEVHSGNELFIKEGRHPVVETMTTASATSFIPNDTHLNDENQLALITGPNMGGKSTYLRQVALITLLAHTGSFVPASQARIPLTDRIFTRVGAADNLVRGQSTFMVEMQETANILHNATPRSLVILDEIGRGTSTYDGVSIAWAITEFLHNNLKSKTLFATHYHELIELAQNLPHAHNLSIAVHESAEKGVVFLYKILKGGVDKSYGIEVAKLAGLPQPVINKSQKILQRLESAHLESKQTSIFSAPSTPPTSSSAAVDATSTTPPTEPSPQSRKHQSIEKTYNHLKDLDINTLTPLQALQKLHELKQQIDPID